eukprot:12398311-Karenia_brevis.AAC.1
MAAQSRQSTWQLKRREAEYWERHQRERASKGSKGGPTHKRGGGRHAKGKSKSSYNLPPSSASSASGGKAKGSSAR